MVWQKEKKTCRAMDYNRVQKQLLFFFFEKIYILFLLVQSFPNPLLRHFIFFKNVQAFQWRNLLHSKISGWDHTPEHTSTVLFLNLCFKT